MDVNVPLYKQKNSKLTYMATPQIQAIHRPHLQHRPW